MSYSTSRAGRLTPRLIVSVPVCLDSWGLLSPARFSSSVDKFVLVPSGGGQKYISALIDVAIAEDVTLFVPCSGAGTTEEDAKAADLLRQRRSDLRAVIQDPDLVEQLHEKDKFISLVHSMGLEAPNSDVVSSPEELLSLLQQPALAPRILKCAAELDDVGRSDLTTYPFLSPSGAPDWPATEKRIRSLPIPITASTPYIVQEFIDGKYTSEWCTHSTVIDGQVRAFVCCPSNDMLMTYYPAQDHPIGVRTLEWTRQFMAALLQDEKWQGKCLDGHYSFDFIHQPAAKTNPRLPGFFEKGRIVAIECNPRVHTAVGLLSQVPAFGEAYAEQDKKKSDGDHDVAAPVVPLPSSSPMSWLAHDLPARLLPLVVPRLLRRLVHPLWLRTSESASLIAPGAAGGFDLDAPGSRDAAWDAEDPLPFFALYHLMWPYLMLRQVLVRRRAWSRINVSTARIFEC